MRGVCNLSFTSTAFIPIVMFTGSRNKIFPQKKEDGIEKCEPDEILRTCNHPKEDADGAGPDDDTVPLFR